MAWLWTPDTCRGGTCVLELARERGGFVSAGRLCAHHSAMREGLKSDAALFEAIVATNRLKNAAVKAVAMEYGTREELHPEFGTKIVQNMPTADVLWRIDDHDDVVIVEADTAKRDGASAKIDQAQRERVKFESLMEFVGRSR